MPSPIALAAAGLSLAAATAALACAERPAPLRPLTDAHLKAYAAAAFDKRAMMFKRVPLGRHRGLPVVAVHPCGDVCPAYTRRIVHYEIPLADCERRGGIVRDLLVPRGPSVARQPFCLPAVLAGPKPDRP
ncbi:MAG TPA: hypothetical protein VK403_06645 [Allosphingosinicella sp.]|nr:hypothetical protein [Allosphingosinicella sp.]